jgi:signal peptidase II
MARWPEGGGVEILPGILHLTRVNNTGAAFGLWKNASVFLIWVSVLSVLFILFFLHRLLREPAAASSAAGWALVAGGALGNLYDRVRFGYVVDCIDLRVWPVFNIADSSICLGVFMILLHVFLKKKTLGGT